MTTMTTQRYDCLCCNPLIRDLLSYVRSSKDRAKTLGDVSTLADRVSQGRKKSAAAGIQETTVFANANILTVDAQFSEAEAMAIRGNKILAVGSQADVTEAAGENAKIVDLGGKTVLPGFIEPHMHFALMAGLGHWTDIGPFKYETTEEALRALKEIADETPEDLWVEARQFDPSLQEGPEGLTTKELDEISTTQPVFVLNASGHLAYCNSFLLELAGIDKDTPDPPGGEYYRYEDGSPNGMMTQKAYLPLLFYNEALLEHLETGFVDGGIRVGQEAAALGITTLCDQATGGMSGYGDIESYREMFETGEMKARIRASLFYEREDEWDEKGVKFGDGDEKMRIVGWKIVTDGSNQGFTGRQREPYLGTEDNYGIFYVEPADLKEMVLKRGPQGWPLVMHGNGDAAIDSILDAVDAAANAGIDVRALHCRIEHCSILHDEQIERIEKHGISPSFLIDHVHYWGQTMRDNVFGEEKVQLLDRCGSVSEAGIIWTNHSDAPVSQLGSLHKIQVAVVRNLWKEPDTILAPKERVSVETAIRAVTSNAAWQCHSEHEIGSLEPDKLADFVILEQDPRKVESKEISDIKVLETWMDGEQVYAV